MIILFFGQPASGKTTLADTFVRRMISWYDFVRIDGDRWREISNNKDYSREGRMANLKSAFNMAKYLDTEENFTPVLSFVTPYESLRRDLCKKNNVIFIYLKYKGDRGRNERFAGDFESPSVDCLTLDTSKFSVDDCIEKIKDYVNVKRLGFE